MTPTLPELAAVCERSSTLSFSAAYATFNLAYAIGMAFGPPAAGLLKRTVGFAPALLILSGFALCFLPVLIIKACNPRPLARCAVDGLRDASGAPGEPRLSGPRAGDVKVGEKNDSG